MTTPYACDFLYRTELFALREIFIADSGVTPVYRTAGVCFRGSMIAHAGKSRVKPHCWPGWAISVAVISSFDQDQGSGEPHSREGIGTAGLIGTRVMVPFVLILREDVLRMTFSAATRTHQPCSSPHIPDRYVPCCSTRRKGCASYHAQHV